jgi:hypothetical protein
MIVPYVLVPFFIRDIAFLAVLVGVATVLMVVLSGVIFSLRLRDPQWRRDAWLVHNAQPRLAAALTIAWFVPPTVYVAIGGGLVSVGRDIGWPIVIAGTGLVAIQAFRTWQVRRVLAMPFDDDDDDDDADADADADADQSRSLP